MAAHAQMRQLVGNACGAVAIMHTVMNNLDRVGQGSSFLEGFRGSTQGAHTPQHTG